MTHGVLATWPPLLRRFLNRCSDTLFPPKISGSGYREDHLVPCYVTMLLGLLCLAIRFLPPLPPSEFTAIHLFIHLHPPATPSRLLFPTVRDRRGVARRRPRRSFSQQFDPDPNSCNNCRGNHAALASPAHQTKRLSTLLIDGCLFISEDLARACPEYLLRESTFFIPNGTELTRLDITVPFQINSIKQIHKVYQGVETKM